MQQPNVNCRVVVESIVAVVAGLVFVRLSSWCDPDPPIALASYVSLFGIGFAFGVFGRSPVLLIGPVAGMASIFGGLEIIGYGLRGFEFEMVMFALMSTIILIAAAIGRGVKNYYRRKMNRVA